MYLATDASLPSRAATQNVTQLATASFTVSEQTAGEDDHTTLQTEAAALLLFTKLWVCGQICFVRMFEFTSVWLGLNSGSAGAEEECVLLLKAGQPPVTSPCTTSPPSATVLYVLKEMHQTHVVWSQKLRVMWSKPGQLLEKADLSYKKLTCAKMHHQHQSLQCFENCTSKTCTSLKAENKPDTPEKRPHKKTFHWWLFQICAWGEVKCEQWLEDCQHQNEEK